MSDINGLHRDSQLKNQDLAASRGQKEAHRARMHTAEHGLDLTVVKPGLLLVIWCQVRSMDKNVLVVQLYQYVRCPGLTTEFSWQDCQMLTGCCSNAFLQRFDARDPSLRSGRHLKALFLVVILNEVKNLDFAFYGLTALGNNPLRCDPIVSVSQASQKAWV